MKDYCANVQFLNAHLEKFNEYYYNLCTHNLLIHILCNSFVGLMPSVISKSYVTLDSLQLYVYLLVHLSLSILHEKSLLTIELV